MEEIIVFVFVWGKYVWYFDVVLECDYFEWVGFGDIVILCGDDINGYWVVCLKWSRCVGLWNWWLCNGFVICICVYIKDGFGINVCVCWSDYYWFGCYVEENGIFGGCIIEVIVVYVYLFGNGLIDGDLVGCWVVWLLGIGKWIWLCGIYGKCCVFVDIIIVVVGDVYC